MPLVRRCAGMGCRSPAVPARAARCRSAVRVPLDEGDARVPHEGHLAADSALYCHQSHDEWRATRRSSSGWRYARAAAGRGDPASSPTVDASSAPRSCCPRREMVFHWQSPRTRASRPARRAGYDTARRGILRAGSRGGRPRRYPYTFADQQVSTVRGLRCGVYASSTTPAPCWPPRPRPKIRRWARGTGIEVSDMGGCPARSCRPSGRAPGTPG
ncbi:hypothetical protein HBB16_19060 [Pseudonocardia sp. MCCB 268]|nr:hypothetical protein [Pseudonocardia cytotoxica]